MASEEALELHMNGGVGETSYANNSLLQRKVLMKVKPILKEHITKVYTNIDVSDCLKVADLGCSSGPNTFFTAYEIIAIIDEISLRLKKKTPAFQIFLNDLPSNDFNTIFKSLPDFYNKLQHKVGHNNFGPANCFIDGAPGSFYGRLFPENSIHFFHSSYSLHWLSEAPEGLIGRGLNKGNIYIEKGSPEAVWKAYFEQFEHDFKLFLKDRSVELVKGGGMVLTFIGRSEHEELTLPTLIGMALHDMVLENKVEDAKLESFDLPHYGPSEKEVRKIIEGEASFRVERLEIWKLGWDADINEEGDNTFVYDNFMRAKFIANYMRAVTEPLLKIHFGDSIMDELFFRFSDKLLQLMDANKEMVYTNLVLSLTKM